LALLEPMN